MAKLNIETMKETYKEQGEYSCIGSGASLGNLGRLSGGGDI